ncbi:MAG: DISARM system phospholipase D-like protein DrmC [Gammaproteobacteria bacterium]|nr:DISARM system phospholipase D-like protein DrmC [Gammaproteobacteria bacterium]MDE0258741.1 DISARM system phospholipase D-like protein DrmC [Gammaproteobacteria bacterium]
MIDTLAILPAHLRKRLARALSTGELRAPYSAPELLSALGQPVPGVLSALEALSDLGVTDRAAGAWVRALDQAARPVPKPDLVWSGPEVPGLHARDTRRVYDQLFSSAKRSLWAVSFAYFDGPQVFEQLARRMEDVPELRVKLLLNIHRGHKDTSSQDALVRRFAVQFWQKDWPGNVRPAVYYDPRSVDPEVRGVLHAKTVVADDKSVFITSANFTAAALDDNIELGLLVRDGPLALRVVKHLRRLIDRRMLKALPG